MNHGVQTVFMFILKNENALVFTTDPETRHGKEFLKNKFVAGSVVLETPVIGKIRGIQFQGIVSEPEGELSERVKRAYLKKVSCCNADGYPSLDCRTYLYQND